LDYIESQQSQLDSELDAFESKLRSVVASHPPKSTLVGASPYSGLSADEVRERTYEVAETLNLEMVDLGHQVNEMVSVMNQLYRNDGADEADNTVR
jgi:hypothetical protein